MIAIPYISPLLSGVSFLVLKRCVVCGGLTCADLYDPEPRCEYHPYEPDEGWL